MLMVYSFVFFNNQIITLATYHLFDGGRIYYG
jgi:hypothetical protein